MSKQPRGSNYSRVKNDFWVYVIELDPAVLEKKRKMVKANPKHRPGEPCVYVGSSTKPPHPRFEQHKAGEGMHSKYVQEFGIGVIDDECDAYKGITRHEAETREARKARRLRNKGWAVWQK